MRIGIIIAILMAAVSVAGQTKPDLSGRWELNAAQSHMRETKWNAIGFVIEHREPKLNIKIAQKYPQGSDYVYDLPLTTDGKAVSIDMGKNVRVYQAAWTGTQITLKWSEDGQRTETWSLSPDGRTLTVLGSAKLTDGTAETWKYVMTKK